MGLQPEMNEGIVVVADQAAAGAAAIGEFVVIN